MESGHAWPHAGCDRRRAVLGPGQKQKIHGRERCAACVGEASKKEQRQKLVSAQQPGTGSSFARWACRLAHLACGRPGWAADRKGSAWASMPKWQTQSYMTDRQGGLGESGLELGSRCGSGGAA